jgi:NADPH:quinone reductase-like Zn-dependent oxidoreductase
VERVYPLEEVHVAVDHAMAGARQGKILLVS